MEERLLPIREVARRLGLKQETVRAYLQRGRWPGVKPGRTGQWRMRASDVDRIARGDAVNVRPEANEAEAAK